MRAFLLSLAAVTMTGAIHGLAAEDAADTLFVNANIYTGNAKQPKAEAIAVRGTRFLFVGAAKEAETHKGAATRVVDLHGATVVPGLTDAHYHLLGVGEREMNLNLEGTRTRGDFLAKVKERVSQTEPGKWVTGRGWIETFWTPPSFPSAADLDAIAPEYPVFLTRADGHAAVVNSAALKIAGIDNETPNPFGGEILRDKTSRAANGMLLDNAKELVAKHIPPKTREEMEDALVLGAKRSVELGWCEIQNPGSARGEADVIRTLINQNRIKLRIYNAVSGPGEEAERLLKEGAVIDEHSGHFTQRAIKCYADGALGSRGAALLEKYSDADTSGFLVNKEEVLRPLFEEALRHGIQIETHAIGDRANRLVLDWYEAAFRAVPPKERKVAEPRWRIEHAQIVSAPDIPRFGRLGVIPSMQPSHAISDLFFAPSRLGKERLAGAYAWQSLLKSGAVIPAGSDAPVERGEPMIEFYAAVARKSQDGFSSSDWHAEQAVSREEALRMFTAWPAFAAFQEKEKGSIEVGKLADLTMLSADIMKIREPEILQTRCTMTVIGGEIVFEATR
ncbi:MAG: amidohydrolase [Chthoniobacterales bacterium]|nr:amidohydrolase [Chthoniobacterales bacterium]